MKDQDFNLVKNKYKGRLLQVLRGTLKVKL